MSRVSTGAAVRYGVSLILYLVAIYFGGGFLLSVGFGMFSAGTGGPFAEGNPILLLIGLVFLLVGYLILLAGTIGVAYKVIADGVATGIDNSTTVGSLLERAE